MVQKKVTIIVPAYNEEGNIKPLIERLIELQQMDTLRNYETIIVDDGSMDKTYDIAHSFEKKYKWLKVIRHRVNLGKTEGIISGLKNSEGEILVILDADLQYDPLEIPSLIEKIGDYPSIVNFHIWAICIKNSCNFCVHTILSIKCHYHCLSKSL